MTEITQADRDAAAEAFFCKPLLNEKHNDDRRVRAFARHREQATEAQAAEIEQWKVDYNELLLEAAKLRAALKNHSYTGEGWRPFKETYEALREKGSNDRDHTG